MVDIRDNEVGKTKKNNTGIIIAVVVVVIVLVVGAFFLLKDNGETVVDNKLDETTKNLVLSYVGIDQDGKPIVGKLLQNVKVLAVKDKNGRHVFENSEEERTPATVIFAVPADMHILLRNCVELSNVRTVATELIPVPSTESYSAEPGALRLTSTALKNFVELNSGLIPEDETPSIQDPTVEQ